MESYVPSRGLIVAVVIAAGTVATGVLAIDYLQSPVGCEELDSGNALNKVLEEQHTPPLEHVDIEGFCDDDTPFYGVTARVGPDLATARLNLSNLGCRTTGRQPPPESLDFNESASTPWYCDLANAGPVLVSLNPQGSLLSKQEYEGVRGFFAPLGADSD
jgi:hypothetical protein